MDWTWYLFRFNGRINRAKLWLALLIILCWMIFLAALAAATGIASSGGSHSFNLNDNFRVVDPATYRAWSWANLPYILVKIVGTLLFLWVYCATSVKRLHDRDRSGWWMAPFFVVPGLFQQFEDRLPDSYLMMLPGLAVFVLYIWGFIEMFCLRGSRKTNRFGADPLALPDTRPRWDQQSEIEMAPRTASPPPVWHVKPGHE